MISSPIPKHARRLGQPSGVAKLVVVPGRDLDEIAVRVTQLRVDDRAVRVLLEIGRDELFFGVGNVLLQIALGRAAQDVYELGARRRGGRREGERRAAPTRNRP